MNKEHYLLQPQQQKLEFAIDDTWPRLPASCHRECKMVLTRMLVDNRARELGFTKVVVIDDDQGKSANGMHVRPGFGELLAAVCRGEGWTNAVLLAVS